MSRQLDKTELLRLSRPFAEARNARRQRQTAHLHAAGPRPVLEALIAVEKGEPLDTVLEDFARVPIEVYRSIGASEFQPLTIIDGDRDE